MMIAWARLFGGSGRRTNTVIAPRFAPTLFVCSGDVHCFESVI